MVSTYWHAERRCSDISNRLTPTVQFVEKISRCDESTYASHAKRWLSTLPSQLFADAPCVHSTPDTEMEPLLFSDEALINFVKKNSEKEAPVTINLGIYQDGTIGEAAQRQMTKLRQAIRGK